MGRERLRARATAMIRAAPKAAALVERMELSSSVRAALSWSRGTEATTSRPVTSRKSTAWTFLSASPVGTGCCGSRTSSWSR